MVMSDQKINNPSVQCDVFEVEETRESEYLALEVCGSVGAQ
jgi:hypothetical protein